MENCSEEGGTGVVHKQCYANLDASASFILKKKLFGRSCYDDHHASQRFCCLVRKRGSFSWINEGNKIKEIPRSRIYCLALHSILCPNIFLRHSSPLFISLLHIMFISIIFTFTSLNFIMIMSWLV